MHQPRAFFADFGGRGDGGKVKWYYIGHFRADRTAHFPEWVDDMQHVLGHEFEQQDVQEAIDEAVPAITALSGSAVYRSMVSPVADDVCCGCP